jgi:hypothetical protein
MPEHSRILAPVTDALRAHLIAHPLILAHLFELDAADLGFEPPPLGLLLVRVPDGWWQSYDEVRELGPGVLDLHLHAPRDSDECPWSRSPRSDHALLTDAADLRARFRWLSGVAPPAALVSWLGAAAEATGTPLAYYHHDEHGDDLYYELAWLFAAGGAESVIVRQTFLVDSNDDEQCVVTTRSGRSSQAGSAFRLALEHLGSPARIEHFPPDDERDFNWGKCRVDPREHT